MKRLLSATLSVLLLSACSDGTQSETQPALNPTEADPASAYPAGPYGSGNPGVGEVVEDLPLRGYFNVNPSIDSTGTELRAGNLQELRASGMTHMAVITAATWCSSCRAVARELGKDLSERIAVAADAGGIVAQVMLDITDDSQIKAWAEFAELSTLVLAPGDARTRAVFNKREFAYVIELETMKVVFAEDVGIYARPSAAFVVMDRLEEYLQ